MNCFNCLETPHKYKCVKCYAKICSLQCMTTHKESSKCVPPPTVKVENIGIDRYHTEDTVSVDVMHRLGDDPEIRQCIKSERLRDIICGIDNSHDPSALIKKAMADPEFEKFADLCLKAVDTS